MVTARDDSRPAVRHRDAMPYKDSRRAARDRIVEREVMKLEQRTAASRSTRAQRDLVVASLLLRPDAGRRASRPA
jgi:hypothetical protein